MDKSTGKQQFKTIGGILYDPQRFLKKSDIKWVTPEDAHGEKTLKQHAFFAHVQTRRVTGEKYDGSRALCSSRMRVSTSESEPDTASWNELEDESFDVRNVCKNCLEKYNQILS